jgi:hypothetical protein
MSLLLRLALTNAREEMSKDEKGMTQVKSYIIGYLFPKAVNMSLNFLTPEQSLIYFDVISQAQQIESHFRNYNEVKIKHLAVIQKLHLELIEAKGVMLSSDLLDKYEEHFILLLDTFNEIKTEAHRRDGFRIIRLYMEEIYKQLLAPLTDYRAKELILQKTKFMTKITDSILSHLSDYHDSVREEAQLLLLSMV